MTITLPHVYSGKVRDIYDAGDDRLLMVASDRMSAFDVVMEEPIPSKGRVLTGMSAYWFDELADVASNHLLSIDIDEVAGVTGDDVDRLRGRIMLCRRVEMLPIECIVRARLTGSAWREYRTTGTVHGEPMPEGLVESDALPEPIFTPSTKAAEGHDMNISFAEAVEVVGEPLATAARQLCLTAFERGASLAAERGIVMADTKFELGMFDGELVIADEVMTPDSSRFWPAEGWQPGETPPSFDKQPVRDYLDSLDWNKQPPPPPLPPEVVSATTSRYIEAYERITTLPFADWPGAG